MLWIKIRSSVEKFARRGSVCSDSFSMGSSDGWMQPAVSTVSSRRRSMNDDREIHFLRVQSVSVMIITTISMRCFGIDVFSERECFTLSNYEKWCDFSVIFFQLILCDPGL